ncbi:MAG TPA: GNAT family N-acetyltransferase [Acidobacteriaceae bacterium]|nr:GNAT family N-acetyltransferase [Acidobacteriaceae bacterium]
MAEDLFANPVWHALETRQLEFAKAAGKAVKYQSDVAPFGAVGEWSDESARGLHSLLSPREVMYMMGEMPVAAPAELAPELKFQGTLAGLQMMFPEEAELPATGHGPIEVLKLSCEDAAEMVELTTIAFPGYFRIRTCEMGAYHGVRVDGRLVSMAGERMKFDRYVEISGVCTHPEYTGRGYAAALITQLLADHRREGWRSCLHLSAANKRAFALYERLGFVTNREVKFHKVVRD